MKALLAKNIGMTQIFDESGVMTPVTVLEAGPCVITQLKSVERDGYSAVQIGFGEAKHQAKPQAGHLKPAKANSRFLTEYRVDGDQPEMTVGDELKADVFAVGDSITVSAVSKGKGFAGTIKRHNFARGPMTHGSHNHRAPGSIGAGYPQHVFKGQKMAGQMGHKAVTVKNLKVMEIDVENNILVVRGAVPGPKKSLVMVRG